MLFFKQNTSFTRDTDMTKNIDGKANELFDKLYKFYLKCFVVFLIGTFIFDAYFGIFTIATFFDIVLFVFTIYMIINLKYFSNLILFGTFFLSNLCVFFDSSYCGRESGISILYFHLIFSIIYLFELRGLKKMIGILILQIVGLTIVNFKTNFKLFYNPVYTIEHQKALFVYISFSSIFLTLALVYVLVRKQDMIIKLYKQKSKEYNRLVKVSKHRNVSVNQIQELNDLAKTNSPAFFTTFCLIYPQLIETLKREEYNLNQSEIELCAYIFLNYTTKDVARFTTSSIRAVESKKYRIRKKINLSPDLGLTATSLLAL